MYATMPMTVHSLFIAIREFLKSVPEASLPLHSLTHSLPRHAPRVSRSKMWPVVVKTRVNTSS